MAKVTHENKAEIGQVIRAYDFHRYTDRYIQGTIIGKGWVKDPVRNIDIFKGYTIKIEQEGSANDGERVGLEGYVPFRQMIGDWDQRVELIS